MALPHLAGPPKEAAAGHLRARAACALRRLEHVEHDGRRLVEAELGAQLVDRLLPAALPLDADQRQAHVAAEAHGPRRELLQLRGVLSGLALDERAAVVVRETQAPAERRERGDGQVHVCHLEVLDDRLAERRGRHAEQHVVEVVRLAVALDHVACLERGHVPSLAAAVGPDAVRAEPAHPLLAERAVRESPEGIEVDGARVDRRARDEEAAPLVCGAHLADEAVDVREGGHLREHREPVAAARVDEQAEGAADAEERALPERRRDRVARPLVLLVGVAVDAQARGRVQGAAREASRAAEREHRRFPTLTKRACFLRF